MTLRPAVPEDAPAFLQIKNALPMRRSDGTAVRGGFLLGTDEATYREYIRTCHCLVAEVNGAVAGFGIVFPDAVVKTSEIWQKRARAAWQMDPEPYHERQIAYFEQLAFLPGHRRAVVQLAYALVEKAFREGAEAMFTTTVREPILNLAAVPFIHAGGGLQAGQIDEHYPAVGAILSDIYCLTREAFYLAMAQPSDYPLLQAVLRAKQLSTPALLPL